MTEEEARNFLGVKNYTQESVAAFLKSDDKMTQKDALAFLYDESTEKSSDGYLKRIGKEIVSIPSAAAGLVEAPLATATGLIGTTVTGLTELAAAPFVGLEKAQEAGEWIGEKFTYQPKTKQAQALIEAISYPTEKLSKYGHKRADLEFKASGSAVAAAAKKTLYEVAAILAGAKYMKGRAGKAKLVKKPTPKKLAPKTIESEFMTEAFAKEFLHKPEVPKFKTTGEAVKFGQKATPAEIKELKLLREKSIKETQAMGNMAEIMKDKAKLRKFEDKTQEGALYKEAYQAAEGRDFSQKPVKPKPDKIGGTTLYGGLPVHKVFKAYEKNIGEPIWDKAIMKGIPKVLEKVPGGKAINRALIYEYRGSLKEPGKFVESMDAMKRNQAIGREYAVDLGNRLQLADEVTQLKMGEYIKGGNPKLSKNELTLANEAKQTLYDLGKQAVDLELLSEQTFFKNAGRYMPRLYTSKEYQSLLTQFKITKPNRLDLSRFQKRKDIPKEIRKEMGEILTPGYPVAKGIMQLTHDIEMAKFFKNTASNKEWAIIKKPQISKKTGKPIHYKTTTYHPLTGKPIEHFGVKKAFTDPIPKDWKQLPSNKKLGDLSESYVHPEIFADISEVIRIQTQGDKIWRKSLGAWKFGKVIMSPKTHARNVMSNSILAHLGGMPMYEQPVYLTKAIRAMRGKTDYWKAAKKEGLLRETFTNAELRSLFDQVEGQLKGLKAGGLPEKFGTIGTGWEKTKVGMRKAAKLYEAEEQWFKMAKYIHNIERKKMSPLKAAKDAEKWLFNYSKVTKFQEKYRTKWYGAPFATFTFKALPRIAEAAVKTPHRFILPAAMIYGLEEAARNYIGDTKEQAKAKQEIRPEYMKGKTLGMSNFPRVPIIDEYGREYYLNLTYILPWGDLAEGGGFMGIPGGLRPFSQPFINEPVQQIANYDFFWKSQIVKEKELAGKTKAGKIKGEAKARLGHLAQTMLPTPFLDVAKGYSALKGVPDYKGRERPGKVVAADVFMGIKIYPVDYVNQMVKKVSKLHPKKGRLGRAIRYDIKILYTKRNAVVKKGKDVKFLDKQIENKMDQLRGLSKELQKETETFKKIQNETY
ncbi:MAG: hypothetical protein E3J54_00835 [Actinobacteria bacterium]|nr:MAG: hypothetical protein E3J54_00835 [Actinomycetota bacterium]